jgi:glycine oxidase
MVHSPSHSLIVVGGGIVGLTIAVAAQGSGHKVTLISRDETKATASGIAAGMIAPAMEAMNDPDPAFSYRRFKGAQGAWLDLYALWPETLQQALVKAQTGDAIYISETRDGLADKFAEMDANHAAVFANPIPEASSAIKISDEWLVEATATLAALSAHFADLGGVSLKARVNKITAFQVTLDSGEVLTADAVVVAAGYESKAFAESISGLAALTPIKGHLLDIKGQGGFGVLRSATGYLADYGSTAKFGATMQAGQDDLNIESDEVKGLTSRAAEMKVEITTATPRTGIRAATPDGWPLIGRDPASGVLVATGMRRNGYIFAPLAAKIILALIEGRASPDEGIYRPDRFSPKLSPY